MSVSSRANIVSILNNDDNPSFAVRSNPRASGALHSSQPEPQHQYQRLPPVRDTFSRPLASSESPTVSPRGYRHPLDPVNEIVQPVSPGSSDGSAYDYLLSQPSSAGYHPYVRQDLRRDPYRYPSRGPAPPRTPPETHSATPSENKSSQGAGIRGTGRRTSIRVHMPRAMAVRPPSQPRAMLLATARSTQARRVCIAPFATRHSLAKIT